MALQTPLLQLATPIQGSLSGTWGDTVNNAITEYTDIAIAGTLTLTGDGAVTLANTLGSASASLIVSTLAGAGTVTAQFAIVQVSGTTTTKVVTGPSYSKTYVVDNASSFAVTFKAAGQTGITVAAAEKCTVYFNGTDYVKVASSTVDGVSTFSAGTTGFTPSTATSGAVTLSGTLATTNGGTGLTAFTANRVFYASSTSAIGQSANLTFDGTTLVANNFTDSSLTSGRVTYAGTGGNLVDSANLTFDGTTLTANALTVTNAVTLSAATANGVMYANGSKVLTTGSALTFDGTNLGVGNAVATTVNNNNGSGTLVVGANSGSTGMTILSGASSGNEARLTFANATTGTGSYAAQISYKSGDGAVLIYNNNAERYRINPDGTAIWSVAGSEQMRLTSTGLGIGTSSPASRLEVQESGTGSSYGVLSATATSGGNAGYGFKTGGTVRWWMDTIGSAGSEALRFYSASAATERMRLDSSGNLGLGVTPSAWAAYRALQVGYASVADTAAGNNAFFGSNVFFNGTNFRYIATSTATNYRQLSGAHEWYTAPSGTAGNAISFTQAMTLDSSGNLGLGVTPSAWFTDVKAFDVNTVGSLWGFQSGANVQTGVTNNAFINSSAQYIYKVGAPASNYLQASGAHQWYTAPSGTAGNAISFSQAMTLDASGNLGVGTTSPGAKLHVAGTVIIDNADANNELTFSGTQFTNVLSASTSGFQLGTTGAGYLAFLTTNSERARITSGGVLAVGTTSSNPIVDVVVGCTLGTASGLAIFSRSNGDALAVQRLTNDGALVVFYQDGTAEGSISVSGSTVSYNTSSDYRLKNITGPITTSGAYIDSLNPVEGTWKADGSTFVGLIAHEVQEASRTSVATGVKDGEEMQGMDYSSAELIANMLAEIKSLRARVAALESN